MIILLRHGEVNGPSRWLWSPFPLLDQFGLLSLSSFVFEEIVDPVSDDKDGVKEG